mmetsp:Transcript_1427/g.5854  ORF Transcript_1427/g.5854 Transcript_1427/m.5854 type:complete len:314 (+) Transcript_1427:152-1093(+)
MHRVPLVSQLPELYDTKGTSVFTPGAWHVVSALVCEGSHGAIHRAQPPRSFVSFASSPLRRSRRVLPVPHRPLAALARRHADVLGGDLAVAAPLAANVHGAAPRPKRVRHRVGQRVGPRGVVHPRHRVSLRGIVRVLSVAAEADGVSRALVVGVIEGEAVALATAKRSNLHRDLHVLRREVVGALGEVSVVQAGFLLLGRRSHVTEPAQAEVVAAVAHVDELNREHGGRDAPADGVRDGDSLNPELRPDLANRLDLAAAEDDLAESRAPEVRRAPHRGEQRADDAADAVDPCLKQTTSIYLPVPGSKVRRYKD